MQKKHYAFAEHETIQAMLHSLFRFQSLEQAQLISNRIANDFTLAPKLSDPMNKKAFVLWVRGLAVSEDESKKGFLGNFGTITIHQLDTGKWTLTLAKKEVPLNKHPLRKAVPRRHPNMGHPVMRAAVRKKVYPTMQAAADLLMKLHEEFPEISVPGLNKIKILTYVRTEKGKPPVQRLELMVVKRAEGEYLIDIRSNLRKPAAKPMPEIKSQEQLIAEDEAQAAAAAAPVEAPVTTPAAPDATAPKTAAPKAATPKAPAEPSAETAAKTDTGQNNTGFYTKLVSKGRKKKK